MNASKRTDISVLFGILLIVTVFVGGAHEASALEIGKPAPDFTLPSTTGQRRRTNPEHRPRIARLARQASPAKTPRPSTRNHPR